MFIKYYFGPCQSHLGHLDLPVKSLMQMIPDTLLKRQFRPFWTHFGAKSVAFGLWAKTKIWSFELPQVSCNEYYLI